MSTPPPAVSAAGLAISGPVTLEYSASTSETDSCTGRCAEGLGSADWSSYSRTASGKLSAHVNFAVNKGVTQAGTGQLSEASATFNASGSFTNMAVSNCYQPPDGSGTEVLQGATTPGTMKVSSLTVITGAAGKPDLSLSYVTLNGPYENTLVTITGGCPGTYPFIEMTATNDIFGVDQSLGLDIRALTGWTINPNWTPQTGGTLATKTVTGTAPQPAIGQADVGTMTATQTWKLITQATCGRTAATAQPHAGGQLMTSNAIRLTPGQQVPAGGLILTIPSTPTPVAFPQAKNDGTYFSIPWTGGQNHYQRFFDVPFQVTEGGVDVTDRVTISKATVEIDDPATGDILQAPFDSPSVTILACGGAQVQVTFSGNAASAVKPIEPPTASHIIYKFVLTAEDPGTGATGSNATPSASAPMHPLWPLPPEFDGRRFGNNNELGGDAWVSTHTYVWMEAHANLLAAINDISGEHGYNLGHNQHGTGDDIDEMHPAWPSVTGGPGLGAEYYVKIVNWVLGALSANGQPNTNAGAQSGVRTWVDGTRHAVNALLALTGIQDQVNKIYYMIGCPVFVKASLSAADQPFWDAPNVTVKGQKICFTAPNSPHAQILLPEGWGQTILTTGTYDGQNPQHQPVSLDYLHLSAWAPGSRVTFNPTHDDHLHITLPTFK